ncbi:MAG: galactokinase, partial [Cyclobacteriaceae bacterium]|nr:galactokinase [Cyclobacteriaceae bacterium]
EQLVFSLDDDYVLNQTGWKSYIVGMTELISQIYPFEYGFNLVFGGNIPHGAGLSSSAALTCGFGYALINLFQLDISRHSLMFLAQKAEHEYAGVKCGIMDQFAVVNGKKDHAIFLDCRDLSTELVPVNLGDYQLVLFNTGVKHSLASSEYNVRRTQCEDVVQTFRNKEMSSLREVSHKSLEGIKDKISAVNYGRAKFVLDENERVIKAVESLKKNDLVSFGNALVNSHLGLSNEFEVSCNELDFLMQKSVEHKGVLGARMMGGGFGGCTINLIHKENLQEVILDLEKSYLNDFNIKLETIPVNISDGLHIL